MHGANPRWGAPRVHGELRKLGIHVGQATVARTLPPRVAADPDVANLSHQPRLRIRVVDFFTVPTATGRVLFVFVVLSHDRRRIVHINVTEHPTAAWTAQQIVDAFPEDTAPRWLLRDRDTIYWDLRHRASIGIEEVLTAPRSPWQNPYVERVIGSIRRECLDHVIVWTSVVAAHLQRTSPTTTTFHTAPPRYVLERPEKPRVRW